MNQALLSGIASKAYDKLLKATESKQPIAVTGLPDTMAAYIASKLCADTGKKVLLISGNDLKAAHDAEDGQQLLETGVACLPGGEIDLTRGASSHESAWPRLEALARAQEGDIRLLRTSMDAALQRMGSARPLPRRDDSPCSRRPNRPERPHPPPDRHGLRARQHGGGQGAVCPARRHHRRVPAGVQPEFAH